MKTLVEWWAQVKRLYSETHTVPVEMASGLTALCWGIVLLLPQSTFYLPQFQFLELTAPEDYWAGWLLVLAGEQLMAIALRKEKVGWFSQYVSLKALFTWGYVAAALWFAFPTSATPGAYLVLAISCAWVFVRAANKTR